ncbi:MAG: winged helix-turn-helix domain-containing protein [Woeseiaceae bacterium]|nr:winged helix-turn-helix domain-containing protein [Woeseiaceae bacterium]
MPLESRLIVGQFTVDIERCVVESDGQSVRIKPKSMQVLECLLNAEGSVVSRDQLFASVWPNSDVTDDVLTHSIAELRRAFGDSAKAPGYIETIPRKGFRLMQPAKPLPERTTHSPAWPRYGFGAAALLMVVLLAVWAIRPAEPVLIEDRSIAVLPFVDMSEAGDQEYFADGITEELINQLVKLDGLRVTGRTSSFYFKGRNEDLRSIGRQLDVSHVLEGSVRLSDETLRVTAQLIDVSDGFHLWSETFDRRQAEVFVIQEEIAENVAKALSLRLNVGERARYTGNTTNIEAHRLVLRGNARYKDGTTQGALESIEMYRQATVLDPTYAIAWERLASAYLFARLSIGTEFWNSNEALARQALKRALELAPRSSIVLQTAAYLEIVAGDFFSARAFFDQLANADIPIPLSRSGSYIDMILKTGHVSDALVLQRENAMVDPKRSEGVLYLGHSLVVDEQPAAALELLEALYVDGELHGGASLEALVAALALDDAEQIQTWYSRAIERVAPQASNVLVRMRELHGDRERSLAYLDSIYQQDSNNDYLVAVFSGYYDDSELVLNTFRRSADLWIFWYPLFDDVRPSPEFSRLVDDMGLVRYWREYGWNDFCGETETGTVFCR